MRDSDARALLAECEQRSAAAAAAAAAGSIDEQGREGGEEEGGGVIRSKRFGPTTKEGEGERIKCTLQ